MTRAGIEHATPIPLRDGSLLFHLRFLEGLSRSSRWNFRGICQNFREEFGVPGIPGCYCKIYSKSREINSKSREVNSKKKKFGTGFFLTEN